MPKAIRPELVERESKGQKIRVRWAPSPTGVPHIGGVRTALFNYLFTKNQGGDFILRIEDTDRSRLVPKSLDKIKESLELLNLNWDDYYVQSERLDIYARYLHDLQEKGVVYEDEGAWRFKVQPGKDLAWEDGVHGKVRFQSDVIEDFVIIKSDKFPTYHFASVVDDHQMQISHVLRGDEWLPSTPKHLMLYESFGWQPPAFVHLPVILGPDHKKLSKRAGAKSVAEYIDEGFLPEAITNFMALLGWAPKDEREIFSLEDLIREFTLARVNKNSSIFNIEKLKWFNREWLKKLKPKEFAEKIEDQFPQTYPSKVTINVAPLVQSRLTTLKDFPKLADPFYKEPVIPEGVIGAVPLSSPIISKYAKKLESIEPWNPETFKAGTQEFAKENDIESKDIFRSVGIATFGSLVTPPLPESVVVIGKDRTIRYVSNLAKNKKS